MKKILSIASAVVSLALTPATSVQAREFAEIYTQCGLGAMIAPNNSTVAVITNITWDWGTTAILSNASSAETCKGGKKEVASLIQNAYPQLTADIAKGQGKSLDALAVAAQCEQGAAVKFKTQVRQELGRFAPNTQNQPQMDKNEDLFRVVSASALKAGCAI